MSLKFELTNSLSSVLRGEGWGEGLTCSRPRSHFAFAAALILSCSACNFDSRPTRAPVTGTVTYRNLPVANASVSFIPADGENIATGLTDSQGKFTLRTFELADGAVIGSHKVQIIARGPDRPLKPGETGSGLPGEMVPGDPTIPTKYFDAQTSGLSCEVTKAGPNKPQFDLTD